MKIKSYLAILVALILLGGCGVSYLLSEGFGSIAEKTQHYADIQLWQKDFQRIDADVSQYLIAADLVIASGETHLAYGTVAKGDNIINGLTHLIDTNSLLLDSTSMKKSIELMKEINQLINRSSTEYTIDRNNLLIELLKTYDPISLELATSINQANDQVTQNAMQQEVLLEQHKKNIHMHSLSIQATYIALVLLSWFWAYQKILLPIQLLQKSTERFEEDNHLFDPLQNGPTEIKQLSHSFFELADSLSFQASHDSLTRLYNRRAFNRSMGHFLSDINHQNETHCLCFIDLDHFKTINDTCGHAAGDELLLLIAQLLNKHVRSSDIVARLGGDEFAILLYQCPVPRAKDIADDIRNAIQNFKYCWQGNHYRIGASIGITEVRSDSGKLEDILNAADIACMQAKTSGRNSVNIFDSAKDLIQQKRTEAMSVNEIKSALENDKFELYQQTIQPIGSKHSAGKHYEILLRMKDKSDKAVSPAVFMPLVERYRLGFQLDCWVVKNVFNWLNNNSKELKELGLCSINLSGQSIGSGEMLAFIEHNAKTLNFPANKICFEITETIAITDFNTATAFMHQLKAYGFRFALDDFGSGFSSFSYLKNMDVDYIKIDGSFVKDMLNNRSDWSVVKAIDEVAKASGKQTIAEFVENQAIETELIKLGIDFAQGYYFHTPEPLIKH